MLHCTKSQDAAPDPVAQRHRAPLSFLGVDEIGERPGYHKRIGNGLAFIVTDNPGGGFGYQSVSVEV
jgi:hypothetical protein